MSAMKFCTRGSTPPPTTIIIKIPEAAAEYLTSHSVAKLKMLDHITEVHRPQSTSKRAATGTVTSWNDEPVNTGIDIVVLLPRTIANSMRKMPRLAVAIIMALLEILSAINPAEKRPTSMRNQ